MIGSVEKGKIIDIDRVSVRVEQDDFNVYKQLDRWREEQGEETPLVSKIQNRDREFVHYLLGGAAISLCEEEAEWEEDYLSFGDSVTFEDMAMIQDKLPDCSSACLLELAVLSPQFDSSKAMGITLDDTIALVERGEPVYVAENLSMARLQTMARLIKQEHKFVVRCVGASDTASSFALTHGLEDVFGLEVFITPGDGGSSILNALCGQWVKENSVPETNVVFKEDAWKVKGEPIRLKLKEHEEESSDYEVAYPEGATIEPGALLQIQLPDKNNLLPGEEGYDENWQQTIVK